MAQFDFYANTDSATNKTYPYFVDIQNGLLDALNSRVVIPLTPVGKNGSVFPANLCPIIDIKNKKYALLAHQLSSVPVGLLKKKEGSLQINRNEIVAAIDFLVTGI